MNSFNVNRNMSIERLKCILNVMRWSGNCYSREYWECWNILNEKYEMEWKLLLGEGLKL